MAEERARDRTRRLQELTAALSVAVETAEVVSIVVDAGCAALPAAAGFAWLLRDDDTLELAAVKHDGRTGGRAAQFRIVPMSSGLPMCDVVRTGEPRVFETQELLAAQYPLAASPSPYMSWAVMPLVAGGRCFGVASFSCETARKFSEEDRQLLMAMMRQAAIAFERCQLVEAERRARAEIERARVRERHLHVLAARLSSAITREQIATITCQEVLGNLEARGCATSVRRGDQVRILGVAVAPGASTSALVDRYATLPLDAPLPGAQAIATGEVVWCATEEELATRYAHLEEIWRGRGLKAWGAVPFVFEGQAAGSILVAFREERPLAPEEREFLAAAGQLAAQALERARLFEAHQRSAEELRLALSAARAATWSVTIGAEATTRDASYLALVGSSESEARADFSEIHPDDRAIAKAAFERTLREGVPYEPEVRIQREDGTYMWIRAYGRLVGGVDGRPATLAGVIVDIDEAKQASIRADAERRINETLTGLVHSFASELDQDRLVRLITEQVLSLVGAQAAVFSREGHVIVRVGEVAACEELVAGRVASQLTVAVPTRSGENVGTIVVGHREPGRFDDEHARVAASVANQAAIALENAQLYSTVREQNVQLELAVERARVADRRKDEFLAMLGHELRNPLAPIVTALELMDLKVSGESTTKERDVIRRQVRHLSRLIDDLLDVSRITGGKVQLDRQPQEISAVLENAVEMASPALERRMQRLTIDVPRTGLVVEADSMRLSQVFQNLLMNAAKYSDPRSLIELRARAEDGQVIVETKDHGIGIGADLLPRVFDLFVQSERALDRADGGLGIGLAIAKSLCELHGGTISVTSDGSGAGSTFRVALPLVARPSERTPVRTVVIPPLPRVGAAARVLVVDDNVDAALMLRDYLVTLGHEPAVAHDGVSALELVESFKPDVCVLDIGLPVMNGYELAKKLRETLGPDRLRLIALTGYGQDADRSRALEVGFDHHLIKPVELEALVPLLRKS